MTALTLHRLNPQMQSRQGKEAQNVADYYSISNGVIIIIIIIVIIVVFVFGSWFLFLFLFFGCVKQQNKKKPEQESIVSQLFRRFACSPSDSLAWWRHPTSCPT